MQDFDHQQYVITLVPRDIFLGHEVLSPAGLFRPGVWI